MQRGRPGFSFIKRVGMDIVSREKRSEIMSRIRAKNTSCEVFVFRYLRRNKVYFQKHYNRIPGCPDIALPRKKKAVFIDGDFWHGWKYNARRDKLPKVYWRDKIENNIRRDLRNRRRLKREGWELLRVWEHEIKAVRTRESALARIKNFLQ